MTVNGDTSFEDDEVFFVDLLNRSGAALEEPPGGASFIFNDDPVVGPALSIDDVSV